MADKPMPANGVAWIKGNLVCQNDRGSYDIWGEHVGWWAFGQDRASALRLAELYPSPGPRTWSEALDDAQDKLPPLPEVPF